MNYFTFIFEQFANVIFGSIIITGLFFLAIALLFMIFSGCQKWHMLIYLTPIIICFSAPIYKPIIFPEWVYYITLISLGLLYGYLLIAMKEGR